MVFFDNTDKDTLVQNFIDSISENIDFEIDFSDGEPLRTIIEAVMQEMELQYWQLEQTYDGSFIDTSYGDDLTELVKILGIERKIATNATGSVKFYRETPADFDYFIPLGTLVSTLPNGFGESIQYETILDATLLTGQTEIVVNIKAIEPGISRNVISNKILIINDPPLGIESVTNTAPIIGGEDEETDDNLKLRTKSILDTVGLGTINALKNKINNIAGVKDVSVLDMARGIGTADVLVLGDIIPLSQLKKDEINLVISSTKAGGIDVLLKEPTINTVNVSVTLTLDTGVLLADVSQNVQTAITNYFNTLIIGETLYKNQLSKSILDSNLKIIDLNITSPATNIVVGSQEITVIGTVTIG